MNLTNNKKLGTSNKIIIKLASFLLGTAILIYFIALPNVKAIEALKVEILNTKINIHESIEKEKNLNTLKNDLKKIEPKTDKLNRVFINKDQELEFITNMEKIAIDNDVNQDLSLNNFPEENNDFSAINLDINVQGDFNSLMNYLKDLETSQYYLNINHLSLQSNNSQGSTKIAPNTGVASKSKLNLNIKADTYFK